ncbi:hypothetical protein AAF712_014889 [Marasmius tenuissimus]|uniref:Uncharacterized protein n=1 Tax=Marasmius tenuissimus TaxID=585030 RepID=A0ABR2ZCB5_9AGAR
MAARATHRSPILNLIHDRGRLRHSDHVSARAQAISNFVPPLPQFFRGFFLGNNLSAVEIVPVPLRYSVAEYDFPESLMVELWIDTHVLSGIHNYGESLTTWSENNVQYHVFRDVRTTSRQQSNPFVGNRVKGNILVVMELDGKIIEASEDKVDTLLSVLRNTQKPTGTGPLPAVDDQSITCYYTSGRHRYMTINI